MAHHAVETIESVREALKSVAGVNPIFMDTSDKQRLLLELAAAEAQLAELRLRVLAAADDVATETAARDAGAWLAVATRSRRGDAAADVRLAEALDRRYPAVATAMREGSVSLQQAHAICRALDQLPADVGPEITARAEAALVDHARDFDATVLTRLGRRVLELVAPEIAEAAEARALAELEANARSKARLTLRALGDGTTRLTALLPDAAAVRLATYLHAYTSPRAALPQVQAVATGTATLREPHPRKLARAFCQLLEDLDPTRLPSQGGDATTLVVTMTLDALRADLGTAAIDTQIPGDGTDTLTAHEARRLACRAKIVPAVLGRRGEVLDLGRGRRLFSPAQNRALRLRDGRCRAERCTIPGSWCESHHWTPWSRGGRTDLADGVLLCSHHHHRVHDPHYAAQRLPNGDVRFARRP
ncbi:MAG: DUF222 domain-containing protein [Nocardioides sp.]|uniref:HNH endonuclease signature motif containing protein n=1 Tax=Nocardioides sp. TaxID=35761 RepID=UPI003EFFC586